jgi:hypothetical protein
VLLAACSVGPAWTPAEATELAALQQTVLEKLPTAAAELTTDGARELPEGKSLGNVDLLLHAFPTLDRADAPDGVFEGWSLGPSQPPTAMLFRSSREGTLALAGHALGGFDALQALALDPQRGVVLLATRRGEQTVATAHSTWCGSLWHRSFRPELSTDGSCFTYVESNLFHNRGMLARTDDPTHGTRLDLPGVVDWPVWPGRDGTRLRYLTRVGGRFEVHDGDRVVATADSYHWCEYDEDRDRLRACLLSDGKARLLFGDRLSPPLDSYRWIDESRDGRHYIAAGSDGDSECVVFDDHVVLRCSKLAWMTMAGDGSTWACAVQEGEACFVVRPDGRSGPFPRIVQMVLAPDGSALAVQTRVDRTWSWTLDGQPLGAAYRQVGDTVILLRGRGGAVFSARDDAGTWLVTPAGRDGPWDEVGLFHPLPDGRHVVCLARRGREAHRRVLTLP